MKTILSVLIVVTALIGCENKNNIMRNGKGLAKLKPEIKVSKVLTISDLRLIISSDSISGVQRLLDMGYYAKKDDWLYVDTTRLKLIRYPEGNSINDNFFQKIEGIIFVWDFEIIYSFPMSELAKIKYSLLHNKPYMELEKQGFEFNDEYGKNYITETYTDHLEGTYGGYQLRYFEDWASISIHKSKKL